MKAITMMVGLLAAWGAQAAPGAMIGGWERPVYRARMDIVQAQQEMADVKHVDLVMTQQDGRGTATGFVLLIDDQTVNFSVTKTTPDRCGGNIYLAKRIPDGRTISIHSFELVLVDHTQGHCTGRPSADGSLTTSLPLNQPWKAVLRTQNGTLMRLAGTPEAVITSQ